MSNRNQQTSNSDAGKAQNPGKPNLPGPGKNPDFPEGEPVDPEPDSTKGGSTSSTGNGQT